LEAVRQKALLLYTSFTGLEPACFLPPSVRLLGPLLPPPDASIADRKLKDFLDGHDSIVLISVGSILRLHQQQLDTLLEGFRKIKVASVWTIQEGVLPPVDDVYVSNWIPQFQCLSHPSVKCFVSHCGLGGVLEAVRTGKPILCLPFFGDAHQNAAFILRAKAGIYLHKASQSGTATLEKAHEYFKRARFTAQEVAEKAALLLREDGECRRGMDRLQRIAEAIDSRGELCRQLTRLIKVGDVSHLVPRQRKVAGWIIVAFLIVVAATVVYVAKR
jgi:UDP:flavonoid glycosyltransferase YjiC (YdhE family)